MQVSVRNLTLWSLYQWFTTGRLHSPTCIQVCRRWHYLCSSKATWQEQCFQLGLREGLGDIVAAIEVVHHVREGGRIENAQACIDWKQAYRDLSKLMKKLKGAVIKSGM